MQTKLQTWIEVHTGTWLGFIGSWLITVIVLRYLSGSPALIATVATVLCTVWSLIRGYAVRRYFNRRHSVRSASH